MADREPTPFGRAVFEARKARNLSHRDVAELTGFTNGFISQIETGARGRNPSREVVLKLAQVLRAPVQEWLAMTGHRPDPDRPHYPTGRPSFRDFVETDPSLTEEQKQTLLSLYITWTGDSGPRRKR